MLLNQFTFSLIALLFFLSSNYLLKYVGFHAYEPGRVFLYPWILMASLLLLGPIQYDEDLSITTLMIIILFSFLFVLGAVVSKVRGYRVVKLARIEHANVLDFSKLTKLFMLFGCFIFVVLSLYGFFEYFLVGQQYSLAEIRSAHWDKLYLGTSSVRDRVVAITKPFAFIFIIASSYYYVNKKYYAISFSLLILFFIVFGGVVQSAGRFEIVFILSCIIYYAILIGYHHKIGVKRKILFGIIILLLGVYILIIFSIQRNPDLVSNELYYLGRLDNAQFSDYVEYLYSNLGIVWVKVLAYNLSYFESPIPKFDLFLRESEIFSYYYMGQYNFPHFYKIFNLIGGGGNEWPEIRLRIADFLSSYDLSTNPWSTGYRDLIIDFGIYGSAVFCFLFGYLSQGLFNKALYTKKNEYLTVAALLSAGCTVFPFLSPFFIDTFIFSIIVALFMALITSRIKFKKSDNQIKYYG